MSKIESVFSISKSRKFLKPAKSGKFLKPGFTVLLSVISLTAIALAGSLTPPATPASTFHTLEELYNSVAGTFDSSGITSSTTGSLIQGIKYINSNLAWASGSNNIWNLNSGFVGIGTTAPTTKLEVQGTASASYLLTGNTLQVGGYSSAAYSRFGTSTTGHSLSAANDLLISGLLEVDGTAYFDGTANFTGTASASLFYAGNGTAASPSFSFRADQDTGIYRKDANSVSISAGSLERLNLTSTTASISNALYVNSTSKVGIGTTTPGEKLDVVGNIQNITNTDAPLTRAGALGLPSGDAYTYDIAVSGRYAYITTYLDPARVIVVDVSKPSSPTKIGSVTLDTGENYSHGIATAGRYVYVTGWGSPGKLITVDVSNPASPTRVGAVTLDTGENNPYSVAVAGRYAYVSTYTSPAKIVVIDISNPASPTRVGAVTLNTNENNSQIVVSGRYVYATTFTSPARVIVIDVSNPASPTRVGAVTLNAGEANAQIAVAGRYAYVSTWTAPAQLVVVDISNPTAPSRVSSMTFPTGENSALSIDVAGRYAYISTDTVPGKVLVADVSNPSSPVRAGVLSFTGLENTAQAVAVAGRYAYAVTYTSPGNLIVVDVTGFETTALMAHSAEIGGLQVRNSAAVENNLSVRGGLTVGINGIFSQGPLSIRGGSTGATVSLLDIRNASGSSILLARDDGKVGIGTSAPSTMLEVQGTASASYGLFGALQVADFASTSYSRFGTNTTGYSSFLSSANDLLISGDLEVDGQAFFDGNASVSSKFEIYNTTGTASLELFSNNDSDKRFTIQSVLNGFGGGVNDRLAFRNNLGTEILSIASSGNVGIGTTRPFAKLQVRGGILADSITLASSSASIMTSQTGVQGFTLFSGGIGTANGPTPAIRLTPSGNLVNIGSIRAGDTLLTGGGTLATPVVYSTGTNARGVALGDVNGDNKIDVVTSNFGSNNVSVLMGNGDGTVDAAVNYTVGTNPRIVNLADFNGDGRLDIAVGNASSHSVSVLMNNGNGTFAAAVNYSVTGSSGGNPLGSAVGDINGDGRPDIIVALYLIANSDNIAILVNNGDGTFASATHYSSGGYEPIDIALSDFNGDGKLDVVATNWNASSNKMGVLMNNGNGTFATAVTYGTGANPYPIAVADVNSDGAPDVAVANYGSDNISLYLNSGDGTFTASASYAIGDVPQGIALSDINGDGKPDIVNTNNNEQTISTLFNNGDGTFAAATFYSVSPATFPLDITTGDLNGDGKQDVVSANSGSSNISVFLNQVTNVFYAKTSTGRVSVGTSSTKSKFTIVDTSIGSTSSGSFEIRSSNTIGSVASISGTALAGGSIFKVTLPASSSANNAHGLLLAQDTAGTVIASWSMGGKLALRSQILSRGAVSNCTGVNAPTSGCIDYAESFPTNDLTLEAGDIVSADAGNPSYIVRAASSSAVLGIVSTNPAALIDGNAFKTGTEAQNREQGKVPIALAGRVPLKISLENGEIQTGDHLAVSATKPGYAAKAVAPGMTVGIALEQSDPSGQSDKILVFVNLDYWVPDVAMVSVASTDQIIETGGVRLDAGIIFDSIISRFEKLLGIVFKNGIVQSIKGVFGIVETDRLCVGNTCVTEKELIDLLQRANVPQAMPTVQITPSPTPTDTPIPYVDPTPTPTATPTPVVSETPATSQVEILPTVSPSATPEPTITPTPDLSPTPAPTPTSTPIISTPEPTPIASETPIIIPVETIPSP